MSENNNDPKITIPDDVMKGLQRSASLGGRSLNNEIVRRLRDSLRDKPNLHERIALSETRVLERLDELASIIKAIQNSIY